MPACRQAGNPLTRRYSCFFVSAVLMWVSSVYNLIFNGQMEHPNIIILVCVKVLIMDVSSTKSHSNG